MAIWCWTILFHHFSSTLPEYAARTFPVPDTSIFSEFILYTSVWYALDMKPSCLLYHLNRFLSFHLTSPWKTVTTDQKPSKKKNRPIDQPPNHWQLVSSLVKSFSFAELPWENQDQICPLECLCSMGFRPSFCPRWVFVPQNLGVWALMVIQRTVF